jgi:glycosyltransferase involved in cell wall biosynthesis
MLRVGLDARMNAYRRGGIPAYTQHLLAALASLPPQAELFALEHRRQQHPVVAVPGVRRARLYTPPHHRLEQWSLPLEVLPLRLDVLHCPDFVAPRRRPCAAVVTIHDLAFLHFPGILDQEAQRYYSQVRASVWHADAVIAVSEATRRDITHLLDLPPDRIDVVYEAAAPQFGPLTLPAGATRHINGIALTAGSFALFVSTLEPRKNLPTLLHALHRCAAQRPGTPYHLVLAGGRGWNDHEIFATIRDLRLYERVTPLGSVTLDDLHWLYNACRLYVNPSRYEGFGLPALEALACGAPTVVAETSSLPEVVGDAALRVPPLDVAAWAEVLARLWHDADLRADLARRGPQRAALFSWERAARETLAIYRRCAANAGSAARSRAHSLRP